MLPTVRRASVFIRTGGPGSHDGQQPRCTAERYPPHLSGTTRYTVFAGTVDLSIMNEFHFVVFLLRRMSSRVVHSGAPVGEGRESHVHSGAVLDALESRRCVVFALEPAAAREEALLHVAHRRIQSRRCPRPHCTKAHSHPTPNQTPNVFVIHCPRVRNWNICTNAGSAQNVCNE